MRALVQAFKNRELFSLTKSLTRSHTTNDQICWSTIPLKSQYTEGTYGFPDAGYAARVTEALQQKGFVLP